MKKQPGPGRRHEQTNRRPRVVTRGQLAQLYRGALGEYLRGAGSGGLRTARALGRLAQRSGFGVFDLAFLHEEFSPPNNDAVTEYGGGRRAAEKFLLEVLSPFGEACRDLPAAYTEVSELHDALDRRNDELAASATRQHLTVDALRASRSRYRRLLREARSLKAGLRQHSARVILAQEEERKRVSRELHDEVGQALAAVNVGLVMLRKQAAGDSRLQQKVTGAQALLEQCMESVHRFARELRPEMLDLFGPYEAIRSYARAFAERTGVAAVIHAKADMAGLDREQELVLFRVAQESITNIAKHARATRVDITFNRQPAEVCMEIKDNGRAFCVAKTLQAKAGRRLGLRGMEERVRLVRGEFSIESVAGQGTRVRVQLPVGDRTGSARNGTGQRQHGPVVGAASGDIL